MKWGIVLSLLLTAAAFASVGVVWTHRADWLPERVPTHWGVSGQPDGWVQRDGALTFLLIAPGVMLATVLLGRLLPWLSPAHFRIEPFRGIYEYIMAMLVVMFGYFHVVIVLASTEQLKAVDRWIVGGVLLLFLALGSVLGKVQRNFYIGVRTPWTLANETVWNRTHRLAAWLFVAAGVIGLVLLLVGVHPLLAMSGVFVAAFVPVLYSLVLYKRMERQGLIKDEPQP